MTSVPGLGEPVEMVLPCMSATVLMAAAGADHHVGGVVVDAGQRLHRLRGGERPRAVDGVGGSIQVIHTIQPQTVV